MKTVQLINSQKIRVPEGDMKAVNGVIHLKRVIDSKGNELHDYKLNESAVVAVYTEPKKETAE